MNHDNYASLEASKKLVEAGISIETDAVWERRNWYHIVIKPKGERNDDIPAPMFTEVWRELPKSITKNGRVYCLNLCHTAKGLPYVVYSWLESENGEYFVEDLCIFFAANPTDALIELLIWVRSKK